jgi:hypothetical protein
MSGSDNPRQLESGCGVDRSRSIIMRTAARILSSLILLIVFSAPAAGQSAIAGAVKDSTGAMLPGVTVEAASPALIEKARSATTDANGQYKIVDLRPGVYVVTFSLTGFTTIRREGVQLPTAFTATINAELQLGTVEETVTVSGESPVVDVQSSVAQSVMDARVLDAVPTGRDVFAVAQLISGVTTSRPDVGGSEGMQQPVLQVHGSSTRDMTYQQDGMPINHSFGVGNQTGFYYNEDAIQEISYQTSALPAEVSQGGVRINMIPKDGGNVLHGGMFATGAGGGMQSDNQSEELVARGLRAPNRLDRIYDMNVSIGGPIRRDRLWFFSSFRRWGSDRLVANTFNPDGTQAVDDNRLTDALGRLTLQISERNKISASYDKGWKFRGHRRSNFAANFFSPEASFVQNTDNNYIAQVKWTSPLTSQLLLDAGISFLKVAYNLGYQPDVQADDVAVFDFVTSTIMNAAAYEFTSDALIRGYSASASYVTGAHNVKVGAQLREGPYHDTYAMHGDIILRLNNGVPDSVDIYNTPVSERESLDRDLGLYLQDSWTMRRLTVNAGIRYENFKLSIPDQTGGVGRWVGERRFAATNVVTWNSTVPRFGIAYDLFGNGKTAIKASASKYMQNEGVSLGQLVNPMFRTSARRSWRDANNNRIAEESELGPSTGFQGGVNTRIDPNLERPHNWEYSASVQHELGPQLSVMAGYFRRTISNLYGVRNQLVPPEAYTPVTIADPLSGSPLVVYNQSAATLGRVDLLLSNQDLLESSYNGLEIQANKRFPNNALIFGGLTVGRNEGSIRGTNDDLNNPNLLINHIGAVGFDATYQANVAGSYPLPYGLQLSGSVRSATGLPLRRTFTVTRTQVPNLTQVTQAVDLIERGDARLDRSTLVDLRVAKIFRIGGHRLEGVADLYNVLNSNAATGAVQAVGASLGRPDAIVDGRLLRLGVQWRF